MKSSILLKAIIKAYQEEPRVAILLSGKGSNAAAILANKKLYPKLNFVSICTDRQASNAQKLSNIYKLSYFCLEQKINTLIARINYFQKLASYLQDMKITTLIYAGFMKISPQFFVEQFPGINIHPADLTITSAYGKPKYIGMDAIAKALAAQETYLASTVHVVSSKVDCGSPIMVSQQLSLRKDSIEINDREASKKAQNSYLQAIHAKLKTNCEYFLYPRVLELLAQGLLLEEKVPYSWEEASLLSLNPISPPIIM